MNSSTGGGRLDRTYSFGSFIGPLENGIHLLDRRQDPLRMRPVPDPLKVVLQKVKLLVARVRPMLFLCLVDASGRRTQQVDLLWHGYLADALRHADDSTGRPAT